MSFVTLLNLELRKQSSMFRGALVLFLCLCAVRAALFLYTGARALDFHLPGMASVAAVSAMLAAVYIGISWGTGFRSLANREQESLFPVCTQTRVVAAFSAGFLYLIPFLILFVALQTLQISPIVLPMYRDNPLPVTLWVVSTLFKAYLLSLLAGCWIRSGLVGAFIAVVVSLIDAACSLTLWQIQGYFAVLPNVYDASQFLIPARLLLDVLLLILALYTAALLTARTFYERGKRLLSNVLLPICCFSLGPLTSWLIFIFLMTQPMHQIFGWPYPDTVFLTVMQILHLS